MNIEDLRDAVEQDMCVPHTEEGFVIVSRTHHNILWEAAELYLDQLEDRLEEQSD